MGPETETDTQLSLEEAQEVANAMMLLQEAEAIDQVIESPHGQVQTAGSAVLQCTGFAREINNTYGLVQRFGGSEGDALGEIRKITKNYSTDKAPDPESYSIPQLEISRSGTQPDRGEK